MTLPTHFPDILGSPCRLVLLHWREDDELWEAHIVDGNEIVWFGYGAAPELAMDNAICHRDGSASRRVSRPAQSAPVLDSILSRLLHRPTQPKINRRI